MRGPLARACLLALALVLSAPGCGDDDAPAPADTGTETAATEAAPRATTKAPAPAKTEADSGQEAAPRGDGHGGGHEGPEEREGGAGDEEPARSLASLTGRDGRVTPRVVRVPPYISVRVELRSADGRDYGLRFGRVAVRAGRGVASSSTTLDGLRPGAAYNGRPLGRGGSGVRIEASAEPGP